MNFGSGNNLLGGASPLEQIMQQRGMDTSILQQQTPSSAGFDPATTQMAGGGGPMPPPPGAGSAAPAMPAMPGLPQESSEAQIIIEALKGRLENDSKMKTKKLDMGVLD